ncbi:unnamed protein product [Scytosiphon promiscuus]
MGLPQLLLPSKLGAAQASVQAGGDGVREGVAMLLTAMHEYIENQGSGGVNGSQVLGAAMRRLTEDPYLTLGVDPIADDGTIKKSYRKLALRYHPDKNKATSTLFQAVQGAHDVLIEPDKRAEYDVKRKRQQEALSRLRKHQKGAAGGTPAKSTGASEKGEQPTPASPGVSPTSRNGDAKQTSSPHAGTAGGQAAPGTSAGAGSRSNKRVSARAANKTAGESAAASGDEKVRQFNKRFYEEFRREAQKQDKSKASSRRTSGAVPGASKHQPPARPRMRSTNRTDSTVTLEWHCSGLPSTTAFELQWRQRGRAASDWVTSPTLVVGKSCRKKNLTPCTCYEFRVRAASAWGWSGHCDPVMVRLTGKGQEAEPNGAECISASERHPKRTAVSGFQSDGIGGPGSWEKTATVEEARRRRSQTQGGHTKPSVQFRSSSIAGTEGAEEGAGGGEGLGGAVPPGMEKTNSWYWRRMSRAAASAEEGGTGVEGGEKEKAQRRRTMHEQGTPSEGGWACVVCKRQNEPTSNSCWVCYTARSYQPVNLDRIRTENDPTGGGGSPLNSARGGSKVPRPRSRSNASTSPAGDKSGAATAAKESSGQGSGVSEKIPSIRVYSIPTQDRAAGGPAADTDGIRVSASTAQPVPPGDATAGGAAAKDPADVWEFTDGDLDNVGNDEWSYASDEGDGGLDTKSDPGDASRYRRSSCTSGATKRSGGAKSATATKSARGRDDVDEDAKVDTPKRYLNGRITKLHNVRAEPIREAKVVGYLVATKEAMLAEVGDWYKVRWHKRAKDKDQPQKESSSSSPASPSSSTGGEPAASSACERPPPGEGNPNGSRKSEASSGDGDDGTEAGEAGGSGEASQDGSVKGTGWCVTRDKKHHYIVTVGAESDDSSADRRPSSAKSSRKKSSTGRRRSSLTADRTSGRAAGSIDGDGVGGGGFGEESEGEECWHELKDEDGSVYYFNTASGSSQWEPPLWLDEVDPATGAIYFVNSYTGEPQWERPEDFVPIVRENPFATTPEQDFIKSVLSPKRSKGPKSFHEAMYKAARAGSAQHLNTVSEAAAGSSGGGEGASSKDAAAA